MARFHPDGCMENHIQFTGSLSLARSNPWESSKIAQESPPCSIVSYNCPKYEKAPPQESLERVVSNLKERKPSVSYTHLHTENENISGYVATCGATLRDCSHHGYTPTHWHTEVHTDTHACARWVMAHLQWDY